MEMGPIAPYLIPTWDPIKGDEIYTCLIAPDWTN